MSVIKVLRGCVASGMTLKPGQVAEVRSKDAATLIRAGKAELLLEVPQPQLESAAVEEPEERPEKKKTSRRKRGTK